MAFPTETVYGLGANALDERAVGRGERVGVAVDALRVAVLGGHPEVAFDGLGDAVGQPVPEQGRVAPQLGEQVVGKSVPPQRGIRQIDWRCRGHVTPCSAVLDLECLK